MGGSALTVRQTKVTALLLVLLHYSTTPLLHYSTTKKLPYYKKTTPLQQLLNSSRDSKTCQKNAEDDDSRNFFRNFARLTD